MGAYMTVANDVANDVLCITTAISAPAAGSIAGTAAFVAPLVSVGFALLATIPIFRFLVVVILTIRDSISVIVAGVALGVIVYPIAILIDKVIADTVSVFVKEIVIYPIAILINEVIANTVFVSIEEVHTASGWGSVSISGHDGRCKQSDRKDRKSEYCCSKE